MGRAIVLAMIVLACGTLSVLAQDKSPDQAAPAVPQPPKPEQAAPTPPPPPPPPPSALKASIEVDSPTYKIGSFINVEFKLENGGDKPVSLYPLAFEQRSVSFDLTFDKDGKRKPFTYSIVSPDISIADRTTPDKVTLKPGRSIVQIFRIPAIKVCKMDITGKYDGADRPVFSNKVTVDITPDGNSANLVALLETSKGELAINLYADECPNAVMNFVNLASKGFYNGMVFHRVVKNFVIQTGCPYGIGSGGPGYSIASEKQWAVTKHERGTVSLSHYEKTGYCGSQFFICLTGLPVLDGKYTVLGKVTDEKGLKVLDDISNEKVDKETDKPEVNVDLKKVSIVTR